MKRFFKIGVLFFILLISIYFVFGDIENKNTVKFFTFYYFILNNIFLLFLFLFIAKTSFYKEIRRLSWGMVIFSGIKTIYEIFLCTKDGWEYLQAIESKLWSIIFILVLILVLVNEMVKK